MRRLNYEKIFEIIWNRTEIVFPLSGRVYFQYYRDKKMLKSFYCSPCSPAWLLGADTLCSGVMSIISAILVATVAIIGFGYRMEGNVPAFIEFTSNQG